MRRAKNGVWGLGEGGKETIKNRAKMLKADWFKNDITHVLIEMVSPLGRVGISFFSSCYHSVYNCISYNKNLLYLFLFTLVEKEDPT